MIPAFSDADEEETPPNESRLNPRRGLDGLLRQSLCTAFGDERGLHLRALERRGQREVDAKIASLAGRGFTPEAGCLTGAAVDVGTDLRPLAFSL